VPVTTVPTARVAATARVNRIARARTSRRTWEGRSVDGGAAAARSYADTATAMSTMDSRKWVITVAGSRPVRTVTAPRSAWAMIPTVSTPARPARSRRPARTAVTSAARTVAVRTNVNNRLPNSMAPWTPISRVATIDSAVHLGTVGQPRPEAVRRTAPPVTTMTVFITSAARKLRRTAVAEGRHASARPSIRPA